MWKKVLLEMLLLPQITEKFPTFFGNRELITEFIDADQSGPLCPPSAMRLILVLSSRPRLDLPSGLFPSNFPTKSVCEPLLSTILAT